MHGEKKQGIIKKNTAIRKDIASYPFRNKNLENMPGEIWKEILIPAFESNILLSNYGRVKSLERPVLWINGIWRIKPEKILSPYIEKANMKVSKNVWLTVGICIGYNKKFYNLLISRWMYYLFVAPFNMEDKFTVITFKDNDNTNLKPDNLLLSNRGAEIKKSFERGTRERGVFNTIPQKIIQLNDDNEIVHTFPSINQASQFFGIDSKTLWGMVKGRFKNKYNVHYADLKK